MATGWQTYPVEHTGGLVTNLSPLQHGIQAPGSALTLVNFEPSVEGGYRRIEGYSKYDSNLIEPYGESLVQGSGQTGTTLDIANIFTSPVDGDTLTITGVSGTYTIDTGGVSFNTTNNSATLTLTSSLASSPADQAVISFGEPTDGELVRGLKFFNQKAYAMRGGVLWESAGAGWTNVSVPSYDTPLVDGASQTGTTLIVDGLSAAPIAGDTFSVAGIEKVYTVTADSTLSSGSATLTINPSLASSPADNAALTFLNHDLGETGRVRFDTYDFADQKAIVGITTSGYPFTWDGSVFSILNGAPTSIQGSSFVKEFKNHLFFSKGTTIGFTAPFNDNDFTAANGGGSINFAHTITGLIVFREQLIVFSTNAIHRITGNSIADWQVQPITKDIGCIKEDTIQEVGGDIAFVGPDGVRMLSATDRIGDFGFAVASKSIQKEMLTLLGGNESFSSVVVREKNQYRVFGYTEAFSSATSKGILGTQFTGQDSNSLAWSELMGFKAYVTESIYSVEDQQETILFANSDGFVYKMEDTSSFNGANIIANFYTPYLPVNDPQIRKTWYKLNTYLDPQGSVSGLVTLKFDFNDPNVVQPVSIAFSGSGTNDVGIWGEGVWGTMLWGGVIETKYNKQLIGSSYTVSIQYEFDGTNPPFSIDTSVIEFASEDRL